MAIGQQFGKMVYLQSSDFAWARAKKRTRPKYVLLIPKQNNNFQELQFHDTNSLLSEAKSLFASQPYEYMEIRQVNDKGFLSFHSERIYKDDKFD